MAVVALLVLDVGLVGAWLVRDLTPPATVPVVDGDPGPQPTFDLSQLGAEMGLLPASGGIQPDVDADTLSGEVVAVGRLEETNLEVFTWETTEGESCVQVVGTEFRDSECSNEPASGSDPSDPLDGPDPFTTVHHDQQSGETQVVAVWRVPDETSVVGLDAGDRLWQAPTGDVVAFPFDSDTTRVAFEAVDRTRATLRVAFISPQQIADPLERGETPVQGLPRDLVELPESHPVVQILSGGADGAGSFAEAANERGLHFTCGGGRGGVADHEYCLARDGETLVVVPFESSPGLTVHVQNPGLSQEVVVPLDRARPVGIINLTSPGGRQVVVKYLGEEIGALNIPLSE